MQLNLYFRTPPKCARGLRTGIMKGKEKYEEIGNVQQYSTFLLCLDSSGSPIRTKQLKQNKGMLITKKTDV